MARLWLFLWVVYLAMVGPFKSKLIAVIILATVGPEKRNQDPILEIVEALPNEKDGDFEANPHGVKRGASQVEDVQLAE